MPVTPETRFELGSLTKAFTATALQLAGRERGLDLDAPINATQMLLAFSDDEVTRSVTLRDVLTHRTALPSHDLLWYLGRPTTEELREAIRHLPLFPDGFRKVFAYNNLLYGAVGHGFEALVGESWEDALRRRLLEPLGMGTTELDPRAPRTERDAVPYLGAARVPSADTSSVAAAGGMRASIRDMTRWLEAHVRADDRMPRDLAEQLRAAAHEVGALDVGPHLALRGGLEWVGDVRYALGWLTGDLDGRRLVHHPGQIDGFSALMAYVPESQTGVVVLANAGYSPLPSAVARGVFTALGDAASTASRAAAGEAGTSETPAPSETPDETPTPPVASRDLVPGDPSASGEYVDAAYGAVTLTVEGRDEGAHSELAYRGHAWPVTWRSTEDAEVSISAAGMTLPLPLRAQRQGDLVHELHVPLSLDPRVPPIVFTRRA